MPVPPVFCECANAFPLMADTPTRVGQAGEAPADTS